MLPYWHGNRGKKENNKQIYTRKTIWVNGLWIWVLNLPQQKSPKLAVSLLTRMHPSLWSCRLHLRPLGSRHWGLGKQMRSQLSKPRWMPWYWFQRVRAFACALARFSSVVQLRIWISAPVGEYECERALCMPSRWRQVVVLHIASPMLTWSGARNQPAHRWAVLAKRVFRACTLSVLSCQQHTQSTGTSQHYINGCDNATAFWELELALNMPSVMPSVFLFKNS